MSWHTHYMTRLTCAICRREIDPAGWAVESYRQQGTGEWKGVWVPFVGDLRSEPERLAHAECFSKDHGPEALANLKSEHAARGR